MSIMEDKTFNKIREIVYERSGINLGSGKQALVSARVSKRIRALGLSGPREYVEYLTGGRDHEEFTNLIDAMSTNVTSFFRESDHFDFLTDVLSEWRSAGQRSFRIWSAASSTGEEPYTIAMTCLEALNGATVDLKVLATDISTQVLRKCKDGKYRGDKVEPIPAHYRQAYFQKSGNGDEEQYTVKEALRRIVTFTYLDLSKPPYPMKGPFDVIFIRNVMIYFDDGVRSRLLAEAYRLLRDGGYLMVGHSESLTGLISNFKSIKPSVYIK